MAQAPFASGHDDFPWTVTWMPSNLAIPEACATFYVESQLFRSRFRAARLSSAAFLTPLGEGEEQGPRVCY